MADSYGRIIEIKEIESGTSSKTNKTWESQIFVIDTGGQYPKSVPFKLFGNAISHLEPFQVGDNVKVSYEPEGRAWEDKWFVELRAYAIADPAQARAAESRNQRPAAAARPASRPAANTSSQASTSPPSQPMAGFDESTENDLPF